MYGNFLGMITAKIMYLFKKTKFIKNLLLKIKIKKKTEKSEKKKAN